MASSTCFVLKSGTVIVHQQDDQVVAEYIDILVRDNFIVAIAENIAEPTDVTEVIDCSDTIISPGFVDTHRHLWQTQLKGRHSDDLLTDYVPRGYLAGFFYNAKDVQFGELSGAVESIDAGTTTIVDHSHIAYSPEHIKAAMTALVASGIRGVFCPTPTVRVKQWSPNLQMEEEQIPSWFMPALKDMAYQRPLGNGRISLGLGFDSYAVSREEVESIFSQARGSNLHLITSHHVHGQISFDAVGPLTKYGLLGPDILLSHCNNMTVEEKSSVLSTGAHISSTPTTELQMGLGEPVCFQDGIANISSLGIDCHSATSASIVDQARLALQFTRGRHNQHSLDTKSTLSIKNKTIDAFNLATIKGARAAGLGDKIGSITVGKFADLVFWDKNSPGMLAAAEQDPVAAIIHHSSVRDVKSVMIDGTFRKRDGKLLPVVLPGLGSMEWEDVVREALRSREHVLKDQSR